PRGAAAHEGRGQPRFRSAVAAARDDVEARRPGGGDGAVHRHAALARPDARALARHARAAVDHRRAPLEDPHPAPDRYRGLRLPAVHLRPRFGLPTRADRDAARAMTWQFLLDQFAAQFALWWVVWLGILLGIVVGILPGFSPQNTLIMLLPLTLAVPVDQALAFMVALYCANHLAGGVPAILMRIPGSGGAAATTLDGYPMARKGQAQQ